MNDPKKFQKYQVYFFLYLAVICELLIIIVERDDAEAAWQKQNAELRMINRTIIMELLKTFPVVDAGSNTQLKVGEVRRFMIAVKGLGEKDTVTVPPTVRVYHGLDYEEIKPEPLDTTISGQSYYTFDWSGKSPGLYSFSATAGTDRVDWALDAKTQDETAVKIGSLTFPQRLVNAVIASNPDWKGKTINDFIQESEHLRPAEFDIEVIPSGDQLVIKSGNIVTAKGFETENEVYIEGTTPDKVQTIAPSAGEMEKLKEKWMWHGVFAEAGEKTVTLKARDNRGDPKLSSAETSFKVSISEPHLKNRLNTPFAGEFFEQNVSVYGLEHNLSYAWTIEIDGKKVGEGAGAYFKYMIPADAVGKAMTIKATYQGKIHPVILDSSKVVNSTYVFHVGAPVDRIGATSFSAGTEYPIGSVFEFLAVTCGRCTIENMKALRDIRVEVVTEDGRDLLDEVQYSSRIDQTGKEIGTVVRFYLKGKVPKDGIAATVRLQAGTAPPKDIPIILIP